MAKGSGLGDQLFIDGVDLSGDVGSVERIASPSGILDVTAINATGHERIYGLYDGEIAFTAFWNPEDDPAAEHFTLRAKGSGADRIATYFRGSGIGNVAAALTAKQINYDPTRAADGSLTAAIQCLANRYGLDFCEQLTAGKRTDSGATEGAGLDAGAATAGGATAYLHVFEFDGTDATVAIQSSSDDGNTDPYANVAALVFTAVTAAPVAERKATAAGAAVERWLRVKTTTSAGFTNLVFAVCATRTPVEV